MSKIQRLREQLYVLQGSKCFYCNKSIPPDERTFEHLIPVSQGGTTDESNGVVICNSANQLLGNVTIKQKLLMLKSGTGLIQCPKHCLISIPVEPHNDIHKESRNQTSSNQQNKKPQINPTKMSHSRKNK